jgi:hypothetical protein
MAMRLDTDTAGKLAIVTPPNYKGNQVTGYTVGGVTVPANTGIFAIMIVRLPWFGGGNSFGFIAGHDGNTAGAYESAGRDHWFEVQGPNNSNTIRSRTASASAGGTGRNSTAFSAGITRTVVGEDRYHIFAWGNYHDGTNWKCFDAIADSAGFNTATSRSDAPVSDPGYMTNACVFFSQIFAAAGLSHKGVEVEQVAVIAGNFPLSGGSPDLTFLTDILAGTKDYSNFPSCQILEHWSLLNGSLTSAGLIGNSLVASGTVNTNCGVIHKPMAALAVDQWQPGSLINFWGGDGSDMPIVTGKCGSITALDYRWVDHATGAAVSGFDFAAVTATISGGNFSFTCPSMPGAPAEGSFYDIEVRDRTNTAVRARMGRKIVAPAIFVCTAAQSQGEKTFDATTPTESGLVSGQHTYAVILEDKGGGKNMQADVGGYSQVSARIMQVSLGGDGENFSGLYSFAKEWRARMGNRPVVLFCTARNTWGIDDKWIPEKVAWEVPSTPAVIDRMFLYGQAGKLPRPAAVNNAGTISYAGVLARGVMDYVEWDWGTADATTAGNASDDWSTNADAHKSFLAGQFFTRKAPVHLIAPFGRYNTNASEGFRLRNRQYEKGATASGWDLLCFLPDLQMDGEGSPHQRSGVSQEPNGEGNGRRGRRLARGLARYITKSIQVMGPRMVKFWRDPVDATIAWIETGWQAGLKTQQGAPFAGQHLPEFYFHPTAAWASNSAGIQQSFHADYNPTGTFNAELDAAFPTRIKLTRRAGQGNWSASGGAVEYLRSQIFQTQTTLIQEADGALTGGKTMKAIDLLNRLVYGAQADADGGRGIPLRSAFNFETDGGALVQSAAPAADTFKLKLTEKREAAAHSLTVRVKDSGGNLVASQTISQTLT